MNIGLIGTGYWGKLLLSKLPSESVRFTCSGRDESEYATKKVDWALVATPTSTHYKITRSLLQRGVNVFCEKPLTSNSERSEELHALADQRGVRLYTDDVFCYRDETRRLKEQFDPAHVKELQFIWRKKDRGKDTPFNALMYHDLSMTHALVGHLDAQALEVLTNTPTTKDIAMRLGTTRVRFTYDLSFEGKDKRTIIDGRTIDYNSPSNDALLDMLDAVIFGKGVVDFAQNRARAISIDRLLGSLNSLV